MTDYDDYNDRPSGFGRVPPHLRAALLVGLPFVAADFFNYYSAGSALIVSLPILALMFLASGALAAKFAADDGRSDLIYVGALSALFLWLISLIINGIIALFAGLASFGVTLLLGVPYICFCAPFQLVVGGMVSALGAWLYGRFAGRRGEDEY